MADGNGKGFWGRLLIVLLPMALAGLVAMASLRSDVQHVQQDLQTKANRETVEAQNRAVLQGLEDLRADIRDLRRVVVRP